MRRQNDSVKELPEGVPLFRREAIAHKADSLFGQVLLPGHRYLDLASLFAVALTLGLIALLFKGEYTRRVQTTGFLFPVPGEARITASRAGTVSRINAVDGASVTEGEALLVIATARSSTLAPELDAAVLEQLRRERTNLEGLSQDERRLALHDSETLEIRIGEGRANLERLRGMEQLSEIRLGLASKESERTRQLTELGLLAKTALEKAQDAVLVAKTDFAAATQRVAEAQNELSALENEKRVLPLKARKRQGELQSAINSIDQRVAQAEGALDAVIRSPVNGRITGLTAQLGQSVSEGTPLFIVMPDNATLAARLLVPPRSAGFLRAGMDVQLRYDAFPFQKFGMYRGKIRDIGQTVWSSGEQSGPVQLKEPAYVVDVVLERQTISAYGQEFGLRSGLTVQADIMNDRRKVIEWIFDPLFAIAKAV